MVGVLRVTILVAKKSLSALVIPVTDWLLTIPPFGRKVVTSGTVVASCSVTGACSDMVRLNGRGLDSEAVY